MRYGCVYSARIDRLGDQECIGMGVGWWAAVFVRLRGGSCGGLLPVGVAVGEEEEVRNG